MKSIHRALYRTRQPATRREAYRTPQSGKDRLQLRAGVLVDDRPNLMEQRRHTDRLGEDSIHAYGQALFVLRRRGMRGQSENWDSFAGSAALFFLADQLGGL